MNERVQRLRQRLADENIDAIVITHPSNRFYLSGFLAEDIPPNESAGHLVISADRATVVTSPIETENARGQAPDFEITQINMQTRSLVRTDAEFIREIGAKLVGFEDDAILYKDFLDLNDALGDDAQLVGVGSLVDDLRAVKTADEIEKLARALLVTDQAFVSVAETIQAGETESAVAWRIEVAMRERGAEGPAFPTIVASGPNAALPHHRAGERQIQPGEPIVIDMGALVDGYCGDLTRTVWVGDPEPKLREIYQIVLEAQQAATQAIRAGVSGKSVDEAGRKIIREAGYGDYFGHSLGHGLGVRVHEAPAASPRSKGDLETGHVITIEPGIYIPGWGGVRIEDVGHVVDDGVSVFTTAPKNTIENA